MSSNLGGVNPPTPKATLAVDFVQIEGLWKSFGRQDVVRDVSMTVAEGQVTCLLGPSGSGKTTLLRCINHLEAPTRGTVTVAGSLIGYRRSAGALYELRPKEIARQRRSIGMVFQHFNLFPHMTALDNVTDAPIRVLHMPRRAAEQFGLEKLAEVGLSAKASAYPSELSGGQQQRVAIARALAMKPRLLLFDEPTSALDPELVGDVLDVMGALAEEGMTMIVVTHEIGFAKNVATNAYFMDAGAVVEHGEARTVIEHPTHERTKAFLSRVLS